MDLAYLTAVTKSSVMPPYDPWFAGGYLNYYYFGQFIVASLIRLTGIETQVAYNLAVPLLFALTVAAAFSVVYNLAELTQRARGRPPGSTRSPVLAGLAAVVLVAVAGNIDGLAQLFENLFGADAGSRQFLSFDFWRSSRMMPPDPPGHEITEFPFFTFLFADLHAHLVAIPFAILATGIALSLFVRAGQRVERAEVWVTVFVLGVTTGALRIINTWDYPTAMLVTVLFVGGGEFLARRSKPVVAAARTVVVTGAVAVVGYIVYLPFHQNFELFNNGVEQSQAVTEAWRYLAIHSIFLFVVLGWLAVEWLGRGRGKASGAWAALVRQLPRGGTGAAALIVVAALPVALASTGLGTVALVATLAVAVVATALLAASRGEPGSRYVVPVAAMLCVALLIGGVVDLVTVKGDIGRMNTVFKFYLHAWTLFGLAAAYLLWLLGTRGKLSLGRITLRRSLWLGGLAVLGAGVLVYTVLGTRVRLQDRFSTGYVGLNGAEYMERTTYQEEGVRLTLSDDLEAIEWLKDNVRGSPVIVEGLTDLYRWGNRYSIYTGLPAVVGWDWHQRQQRVDYAWAVTQRRSEVDQFYSSPSEDDAIAMLQRYGVRYVIVGQLEAVYYPPAGLEKFGRMAVDGLAPVFQNGRVTIYEYRPPPSTLAAAR
jgi:YYY domain-containing protein